MKQIYSYVTADNFEYIFEIIKDDLNKDTVTILVQDTKIVKIFNIKRSELKKAVLIKD